MQGVIQTLTLKHKGSITDTPQVLSKIVTYRHARTCGVHVFVKSRRRGGGAHSGGSGAKRGTDS